jgi:predicted YcjX-like family ATPase
MRSLLGDRGHGWKWLEYERRIGLVGVYSSGKTVFLTSLIDHLKHHNPQRFSLRAADAVIRKFRAADGADPGWAPFDYPGYRDAMVNRRQWPDKTIDRAQFVCTFERSDWRFGRSKLKFYDLPGERIADAAMAGMDFPAWSDHVIRLLVTDLAYRQHAEEFLRALDERRPEAEILAAYRLTLARLIKAYKPYISPSTFYLDTRGGMAKDDAAEQIASERFSGLDAASQFAPLSPGLRQGDAPLASSFAGRYDGYRAQVVVPLVRDLAVCDVLIVLVDVTMLLAGGTGMYNDNLQLIVDLLNILDPGETLLGRIVRDVRARVATAGAPAARKITRIAFVAPKLDQVHPLDRDRMTDLLRQMVGGYVRDRDGLRAEYFNCSAVVSTVVVDPKRRVLGVATGADGAVGGQQYDVSPLPDDWPDVWEPGAFCFPEVPPRWPARKDLPPHQINLNRIFEFVVS